MPRAGRLNIVIADGQDVVRRGLRSLFSSYPDWHICGEAGTGRGAVSIAIETKPDIVILDVYLPDLSGIDTARWIRRVVPATEILFYTAHDEEYIIADALKTGARGYVLKSEKEDRLIDAIQALARHTPFFSTQPSQMLLNHLLKTGKKREKPILTRREEDIVQLLSGGRSNREIASRLQISIKTVEAHRTAIMRKLGLKSFAELVRFAIRNKLIQP